MPILPKCRGIKLINIPKKSDETIVYAAILNRGQSLLFNYESKEVRGLNMMILSHL